MRAITSCTWRTISLLALALVGLHGVSASAEPDLLAPRGSSHTPKLVLQITVDQLRGDLPMRFLDRLPPGGFRFLLEDGVHFVNTHYEHANTETAVGHATLVTGATPPRHGIFAGHRLQGRSVARRVGPHDIAPTLSAYLGIKPPSGSIGNPLVEVIEP